MKFDEVRKDLDLGKVAWRTGWADKKSYYKKTPLNSPYHGSIVTQDNKFVYDISNEDRAATDWQTDTSREEPVNEQFQQKPLVSKTFKTVDEEETSN